MFSLNRIRDLWRAFFGSAIVVVLLATIRAGAADNEPQPAEPPLEQVARVVEREVTDYEVFAGRVEAAESVNVASRVTGYLTKVAFKDGSDVKKGDLLFEIDDRPYQAQVDQAEAEVRLAEARLNLAQAEYQRGQELIKSAAIAQSELAKYQAAKMEAQGELEAAKAKLDAQKLMLGFCKVVAPIDGRAGRASITPGNLVKQDETILTTIVSLDPICVGFDMDERTWLRLARAAAAGGRSLSGAALPLFVQTIDEKDFPHQATVNFIGNEFNRSTGTIAARATLPNGRANDGVQAFMPGMFVRARIQIGPPHRAVLVSDRAIRRSSRRPTVDVVGDDDRFQSRSITVGALQDDGLRVVEQGLKPDDRIVVESSSPQQAKIRPQLVPMPTNDSKPTLTTK